MASLALPPPTYPHAIPIVAVDIAPIPLGPPFALLCDGQADGPSPASRCEAKRREANKRLIDAELVEVMGASEAASPQVDASHGQACHVGAA
jgi:hypothetical protein